MFVYCSLPYVFSTTFWVYTAGRADIVSQSRFQRLSGHYCHSGFLLSSSPPSVWLREALRTLACAGPSTGDSRLLSTPSVENICVSDPTWIEGAEVQTRVFFSSAYRRLNSRCVLLFTERRVYPPRTQSSMVPLASLLIWPPSERLRSGTGL